MRMSRVPFFSWSALVASIGLLLVLPVLLGVLIYLYLDHHYARALFGGNVGISSWIGFALTQPATYLFALPAIGLARRARAGHVPQADAAARRRLRRPGDHRRRRPLGRHPAGRPRRAVVGQRSRPRRVRRQALRPRRLRPVHAAPDPRRGHRARRRRDRRPAVERRRDVGQAAGHGGVRVRVLRRRDDPRRHARRRPRADHRPRPAGHGVRGGRVRLRRLRRRARRAWAPSATGRRSGPAGRSPTSRRSASPRSGCWPPCSPRCRTTSPASPISRPPPGTYDYDGPAEVWNVLVTLGHAPDAPSSCWRSSASG